MQDYLARVKTERKKIIRYIQLVHDEEFVGGLIVANEQIILALQLYDKVRRLDGSGLVPPTVCAERVVLFLLLSCTAC